MEKGKKDHRSEVNKPKSAKEALKIEALLTNNRRNNTPRRRSKRNAPNSIEDLYTSYWGSMLDKGQVLGTKKVEIVYYGFGYIPISNEKIEEFDALCEGMFDETNPIGEKEISLLKEIIGTMWKLKRFAPIDIQLWAELDAENFDDSLEQLKELRRKAGFEGGLVEKMCKFSQQLKNLQSYRANKESQEAAEKRIQNKRVKSLIKNWDVSQKQAFKEKHEEQTLPDQIIEDHTPPNQDRIENN